MKDENINIWNQETKQKDIEFNPHQFIRKLNEISTKPVKFCKWKEYSKLLKDITDNNYKTSFYKLYHKLSENVQIKAQIPLHILNYMKKIEEQINDIDIDSKNDEEFNKEFENDRVTKKLLNREKFVEFISSYFNFQ